METGETLMRWSTWTAAVAAALGLMACSRSAPPMAPPAPPLAEQSAPSLAAGPTPAVIAEAGLQEPAGSMAPIPNSPEPEPVLYAASYDHEIGYDHRPARHRHWVQPHGRWVRHWYYRHHHLVFEHPERGRPSHHHLVRPAAPHPMATHPAVSRTPLKVRPEARPVLMAQPQLKPLGPSLALPLIETTPAASSVTPAEAAAAPPIDLGAQLGQLTMAVAVDMKSARLDIPPALASGGEGKVVLTLPADLLATIRAKAGEVRLGPAATRVLVSAKLAGQGYAITPNQEQTARLEPGQPTSFGWQVAPSSAPGGVLTADMTASLRGDGIAKTFALGAVTAQIAAPAQAAPAEAAAPTAAPAALGLPRLPGLGRFRLHDLAIPGHPTLAVPGLGPVASEKVVAAGILALVLILLISIMRSASARRERAERRRRFHRFEATTFGDEHPS